jgi:hypothetical protein
MQEENITWTLIGTNSNHLTKKGEILNHMYVCGPWKIRRELKFLSVPLQRNRFCLASQ